MYVTYHSTYYSLSNNSIYQQHERDTSHVNLQQKTFLDNSEQISITSTVYLRVI